MAANRSCFKPIVIQEGHISVLFRSKQMTKGQSAGTPTPSPRPQAVGGHPIIENAALHSAMGCKVAVGRTRTRRTRGIAEFIKSFSGSQRYVISYLGKEVLDRQPAEL